MNGYMLSSKPMYVALAQKKAERKAFLEQQYQARQVRMKQGVPGGIPGIAPLGGPISYAPTALYYPHPANHPLAGAPGSFYPMPRGRWPGQMPAQPGVVAGARPMNGFAPNMPPYQGSPMARPGSRPGRRQQQQQPMPGGNVARAAFPNGFPPGVTPTTTVVAGGNVISQGAPAHQRRVKYVNSPRGGREQYQLAHNAVVPGQHAAAGAMPGPLDLGKVPGAAPSEAVGDMSTYGGLVSNNIASNDAFDTAALADASPEQVKQRLGEKLYPMVLDRLESQLSKPDDYAGKITGMLLEMDDGEILHLLEHSNDLDARVNEAISVLFQSGLIEPSLFPGGNVPAAVLAGGPGGDSQY
jgi:polyadenylate-binding protein